MRTKNFIFILCSVIVISFVLIIFGQNKPEAIQNIVSTTHQQFRNFQDNLRDAEAKTLVADQKYLKLLGFGKNPRLYPNDIWRNTSLPVIVTSVQEGHESQVYSLIGNIAKVFPNNTLLIYDLGLSSYTLKFLLNHCNNSRCQIQSFSFSSFPSHVTKEDTHAYRPLIIQDALQATGAVFYIECSYRFTKHTSSDKVFALYEKLIKDPFHGIITWPMNSKNPVSSLTHKKMFEYFHTDAENFLFLPMVSADVLMAVNSEFIHQEIMLPWVQCTLTQDCLIPIGAQSGGCRFDKKPLYSTVYLCAKKHNKQKLVMKEIKTNLLGEDLKAAKNEVAILKALKHPNIILYYDSYSKNSTFYIMMEYATKGTLHEYLYSKERKISPQRVMNYFTQILMGLDHIHEKKVIHRDLKCENIFLTGRKADVIKIGDFGISTLTLKNRLAKTVVGTCNYLAPELCDEKPYDHKVDIWSLGCILYELCMKEKMFEGSLSHVITSIINGRFKKVDVPTYGQQMQEIIDCTMKVDPRKRPDTKTLMCFPDIFPTMYVLGTFLGCIF